MTRVIGGVAAAIVVLTLSWWFAFYNPANQQQEALELETVDLTAQQTALRTQLAQLSDIRDREVDIRADIARLEQFIPTNPSQASLIRQAQLAADASQVSISSLVFLDPALVPEAPLPSQPGLVLGSIGMTGTLEGGYFQIVDFFRRLEVEVSRAVLVETISITESEDGFPRLVATFTADVFALISAPAGSLPTPTPTPAPGEPGADGAPTDGAATEGAAPEGEEDVSLAPTLPTEVTSR